MAAGPGSNHLDRSTADHPVGDEAGRDDEEKPAAALATGHPDVARSLDPGGAVSAESPQVGGQVERRADP
jgi:hypothetical protein